MSSLAPEPLPLSNLEAVALLRAFERTSSRRGDGAVEIVDAGASLLVTMELARRDLPVTPPDLRAMVAEGVLEVRAGDAVLATTPLPAGADPTRCHWWVEDSVLTAVIGKVQH